MCGHLLGRWSPSSPSGPPGADMSFFSPATACAMAVESCGPADKKGKNDRQLNWIQPSASFETLKASRTCHWVVVVRSRKRGACLGENLRRMPKSCSVFQL